MAAKRQAVLGFSVRTGRAVVVAVGGARAAPEVLDRTRIDVATTFEEGAVFHMAQELPLEKARAFARDSEARFVARARTALGGFVAQLEARIVASALAAPLTKSLPPFETILKAHPLLHAAEGELYRRVFMEAGTAVGPLPLRLPPDTLEKGLAQALKLTPAKVAAHLVVMGKAAGRPWAADQKRAALAAWLVLAGV